MSRTTPNSTSSVASNTASTSSTTSSTLQSLIQQKRSELASLQALRDLSAQLTGQIELLGDKISTLDDGFEAVGEVMGNWGVILKVLGMVGASATNVASGGNSETNATTVIKNEHDSKEATAASTAERPAKAEKPETLVRIPVDTGVFMDDLRDSANTITGTGTDTDTNQA